MGKSVHSQAVSHLTSMGLHGIPIVEKVNGELMYSDANGNRITKKEAMDVADGVAYYLSENRADPTKGRLRHRGTFVSKDDASTVVSRSRSGNNSDVANLRDLDGFGEPELQTVAEDAGDGAGLRRKTGGGGFIVCPGVVIALLVYITFSAYYSSDPRHDLGKVELLGYIDSESTQSLEIEEALGLSRPLRQLLAKAEKGTNEDATELLLDEPTRTMDDELSVDQRKALAAAEIDRIVTSRPEDILGTGTCLEKRRAFNRIARLLHPDKGLVSP